MIDTLFRYTSRSVIIFAGIFGAVAALAGLVSARPTTPDVTPFGLTGQALPTTDRIQTDDALARVMALDLTRNITVPTTTTPDAQTETPLDPEEAARQSLPRISAIVVEGGEISAFIVAEGRFSRAVIGDTFNGYEVVELTTSDVTFADETGALTTQFFFKPDSPAPSP
jgi:hypothetical protein